jgi:tellurite resistance protein TerC
VAAALMRKILVGIMGGTVLLIGVIMIVTPGPAIVVIPIGLGILATEFAWARHYKEKLDAKWAQLRGKKKVVE